MTDIKKQVRVYKDIYIDYILIKDFYLGSYLRLLLEQDKKEEFEELVNNLDIYNNRISDQKTYLSTEDFFSQEDLIWGGQHRYAHDQYIFQISPLTSTSCDIEMMLIQNNNHASVLRDTDVPNITFNIYPLKLDPIIQKVITSQWSNTYQVNVDVISEKIQDVPYDRLISYDYLYLYQFNDYITRSDISKAFSDSKLVNTKVKAIKHVHDLDKVKDMSREAIELDFIMTETHLALNMQFSYLEHKILLK